MAEEQDQDQRKKKLKRVAATAGGLVAAGGLVGLAAGKRLGEANVLRKVRKSPENLAKVVHHATGGKDLRVTQPGLVRRVIRAMKGQDVYKPNVRIG